MPTAIPIRVSNKDTVTNDGKDNKDRQDDNPSSSSTKPHTQVLYDDKANAFAASDSEAKASDDDQTEDVAIPLLHPEKYQFMPSRKVMYKREQEWNKIMHHNVLINSLHFHAKPKKNTEPVDETCDSDDIVYDSSNCDNGTRVEIPFLIGGFDFNSLLPEDIISIKKKRKEMSNRFLSAAIIYHQGEQFPIKMYVLESHFWAWR
jgi:hypothetical protein